MIAWRHSNRRARSLRARHSGALAGVVETTLHMQLTEFAYPRRRPAFGDRCRSYVKQRMIIGAVPVIGVGVLSVLMLLFERES